MRLFRSLAGAPVTIALASACVLLVAAPASASPSTPALSLLPASCPYSGVHYYAYGSSGYGSNKGTGAEALTWAHWSLNGHSDGFSDEAVWTIDNNNQNDALEVGFSTGISANGGFSNNMYPYYTLNNGANEYDSFSTELPTNTDIWMSATSNGSQSWAYIYNKYYANGISYGVSTPRLNYEQSEVNYHDIWMGGGSGSDIALEYQNTSNQWYDWGYITGSADSPYWIDLYQPNGADEGGYGTSC